MEHGKKALVRVVFSAVYAYIYYRIFRVNQQSQTDKAYDYDFS